MNYTNLKKLLFEITDLQFHDVDCASVFCAIKKDLKEHQKKETLTMNEKIFKIFCVISDFFNITIDSIKGTSRHREFLEPRHFTMYLIKEIYPTITLKEIGYYFKGKNPKGKDHATVISAIRNIKNLTETIPAYKNKLDRINERLEVEC